MNIIWQEVNRVILYGYGLVGRACINKMQSDFFIDYIMEKDEKKHGMTKTGLEVISFDEGLKRRTEQKIIVMTGGRVYKDISEELVARGLKEYIDFCAIEEFITDWYWVNRHENSIMELHMALTMRCTLNCRDCNMFVPYYDNPPYYSVAQIKEELDLLFSLVDSVFCLTFLGGEPLLYKEISELLRYINNSYIQKISSIKIVTNGTIEPSSELLELVKDMPVWFSISDYTEQVKYGDKLQKVKKRLEENDIEYISNKDMKWCSFGFPSTRIEIKDEDCRKHMEECSPIFHGYNDGKIYYCHVAWSAEKLGAFKLTTEDYIDLKELASRKDDRHRISEHCFGRLDTEYVSFCKRCGGCGRDNNNIVDAGVQKNHAKSCSKD